MGFLRKNPEGTHLGQVKDAYPGVATDIARLQKEVGLPLQFGKWRVSYALGGPQWDAWAMTQ